MSDFTAVYLPALPPHKEDPSRSGFASEDEAEKYLFTQMCSTCRGERQRFEDGVVDDDHESETYAEQWPACACEWLVVPTEKANGSIDQLFEAAGCEVIYPKTNLF